ncbi:hypothetical protein EDD29_2243 [Actinocorallia herbida]|uniref:Acetyltransferase (GNAT) family protein n=1 Tax=Actinocorallia herbida TaxID=58109 RepID=A0A3N1CU20_9ACTN|nr:hypothetical protein [Actinocorallia herbida]ROO84715.1 hypothetical protein EDD29_2243 [Actinocorallia herbida]
MTVPSLPALTPRAPWAAEPGAWGRSRGTLLLRRPDGVRAGVRVERCAAGRLGVAYPVGAHDVEIAVTLATGGTEAGAAVLDAVVEALWAADPRCRRVVFAAAEPAGAATARRAGFRPAAEVDLASGPVELLVREPEWVTAVDLDLDRVPT